MRLFKIKYYKTQNAGGFSTCYVLETTINSALDKFVTDSAIGYAIISIEMLADEGGIMDRLIK